ncbi:superoxide dismutase family protein, partial [Salmonella enterica]|uniref:superoxide dismutase family protein n=1 Tax=Salmonella enterica TaxID=28901 RepID=UPI003D2D1743
TLISADGIGKAIGSVTLRDSRYGLVIEPKLAGLPAGWRGMHIHQNPSCAPADQNGKAAAGFAAGGHMDPASTGAHRGPLDKTGHLGDLPFLTVDRDGTATALSLAPRLKVSDVAGHAL